MLLAGSNQKFDISSFAKGLKYLKKIHICLIIFLGMLGSCIALFIIALLYEGLKVLREVLLQRSYSQERLENSSRIPPSDEVTVIETASFR